MEPLHADFSEYIQDNYQPKVVSARRVGRTTSTLINAVKEAGSWNNPPTPDLVIFHAKTVGVNVTADFGAGRFTSPTPPHTIALKPPEIGDCGVADAAHELVLISVPYAQLLKLAGDGSGLPADGDFGFLHTRLMSDPDISTRILALNAEMREGGGRGALFADGALLQIASGLLELRDGAGELSRSHIGGLAPWQVKRVCEAMIAGMDLGEEELSLAELALTVGLSANHFCRSFAISMGQPPHRWISAKRIERSKVLMADPSLSLTDVAQLVGYASQSAFGRAFLRAEGRTPSDWRRYVGHRSGGVS